MSVISSSDLIGSAPSRRKLIAVVYADMVGYSRLIALDDIGTLERLRSIRGTLIDPAIKEHGGKVVQTAGDSLLIMFDSIDGAVRCAVKIQQQMPDHDGDHPLDRAIRFRVGINIGDVIADGTDLHGDGVNVAVRLQAACPPGGICVSRAVRDHVHDRLDLTFEELGTLNLKNIVQSVEGFVLRFRDAATTTPSAVVRSPVQRSSEVSRAADKPSIAVLAFTNMSGDSAQEYFSDGVADDIITELSRSRALFVIARNSSFNYRGHTTDVKQIARELGVRYVLEGSVRRAGEWIRITAQLIEATSGTHIWAERYDRDQQNIFAVQDAITQAVVTAIGPAVADAEMHRAMRRPPKSLGTWELYQQGLWHLAKVDSTENDKARGLFERAIELDPMFAAAYVGLSRAYKSAGTQYLSMPLDEATGLACVHARKAIELDPGDSETQAELAGSLFLQGEMNNATEMAQQALSINPNCARAHRVMGAALISTGRTVEGRQALGVSTRLSPRDAVIVTTGLWIAISHYFDRDYDRCVEAARRQLSAYPNYPLTYRWLAAALGQLGRAEEARVTLDKALALLPRAIDVYDRNRVPWSRPEDYEHMRDGLRKAGWHG
jgi:adenylate cyclase